MDCRLGLDQGTSLSPTVLSMMQLELFKWDCAVLISEHLFLLKKSYHQISLSGDTSFFVFMVPITVFITEHDRLPLPHYFLLQLPLTNRPSSKNVGSLSWPLQCIGFGGKSAKLVCVTKQEDSTVLPEQMMLKLSEFLAMTDGGRSEKSILKKSLLS